jgi:hypothetical protein
MKGDYRPDKVLTRNNFITQRIIESIPLDKGDYRPDKVLTRNKPNLMIHRKAFPMKQSTATWLWAMVMITPPLLAQQSAQHPPAPCAIRSVEFDGWQAKEVANDWVRLTFVPQLGGRLMQVAFDGHSYLFVNPVYKGKYISPDEAGGRWINYGGDKIWPLPEGNADEQHWNGASTALDDGDYTFAIVSQSPRCIVRLQGPPDNDWPAVQPRNHHRERFS